ncbi:DUF2510 domain-containing protein [Leifsonia shinshuensis]|uniref:DUF2510 domain-containing protein n=1 Tax=Leifsonia shinshuensis TaxID=150026 RepID=UPI001626A7A3|nr:DUF2510 domain-containing protein [Leifsonia shinshuensis]
MDGESGEASRQLGPGWYPDPFGEAALRWWDGTKWEAPVSAAPGMRPAPPAYSSFGRRPLAPEAPVYTTWIWLVLLLPLVGVVASLATIGTVSRSFTALAHPGAANLALLSSPAYIVNGLLSWLVFGLSVVFSWLDYRALENRGVDRPFHWAWSFLAWPVYTIGRAVIVRRVAGGRGSGVLWASIAVLAISVAAGIAAALILSSAILQTIHQLPPAGA